jgi:hypothetical protein
MTALVWFWAGCLIGLAIVLLIAESLPYWREVSRRIDADAQFLQAIPEGMEDTTPELLTPDPSGLRAIRNERERRKMPQDREWS